MSAVTLGLLVMSSALNAALAFIVFAYAGFTTSPDMPDVTMRIGFYVLNAAAVAAVAAVFLPWIFTRKKHNRRAVFFSLLPLATVLIALAAFLTLDGWLDRTFSS